MLKTSGLINRINRAFLLQGVLISVAAALSVYFAKVVIDEILIKQAIAQEAEYYWENYRSDETFALPDTLNLTGFSSADQLPAELQRELPEGPGFHEFELAGFSYVLHSSHDRDSRLYLIYNRGQVDTLAAYYGLFPLALVLIVLYLSLWATYRFSRRMISPVSWLARQVNEADFNAQEFSLLQTEKIPYDADDEIKVLSDAMIDLGERLQAFIERERNFTRDASHELRSPLTVIRIAADMLLAEQDLTETAVATIDRIKRAAADMEELIEAFLLLARESEQDLSNEPVCINDVISEEIERTELISRGRRPDIHYAASHRLIVRASDKVLSALFGNLLRNAVLYTDQGDIEVTISGRNVTIKDSGRGIPEQQVKEIFKPYYRGDSTDTVGHGVGLTIVKRLSDRFNWPITINSAPGTGTSVTVAFPDADTAPCE
ncbi:MAG: HAMP domain-containing histidine kinase [Thiotrichales bacterium]|nr:MAG: HAMP domain-containing histidine kinase [Thiotrichales bacterium]